VHRYCNNKDNDVVPNAMEMFFGPNNDGDNYGGSDGYCLMIYYVMFATQYARNIAFFIDFYVFFGCGILSNTLQIYVS